ncbi:substrate-binding domain-containing protein [Sulfuriroseicoccus oceanibius]|uniref:Substrate-binding domain-containing protein n=1 Tax=Sulfuriroseicoccus oceanibius TaxID=2707525 RepID=A0A6B3LBI9_9BACT|nr:substrate-binding domain-containing protein [Sulfuriroseicoccus oceanibius]QQL44887.1 substrate-binding domain-containing protein [Sulfuriroseicoccus oceanibius]
MASLPLPDNRTLQTVDVLKGEIDAGRFANYLPGERELARRMNVSRKTLRKAIDILEAEQRLLPASPGKRRQIRNGPHKRTTPKDTAMVTHQRVVTIAPKALDQMGGPERLFQSTLNRLCTKSGIDLTHRHIDIRHMQRPSHRLTEFVDRNPAELYLLQHGSLAMQRWFKSTQTPCLVLGDRWDDLKLPNVSADMGAMAVHAASLLQRKGHQHVAMLFPSPSKRGLEIFADRLVATHQSLTLTLAKHNESPESIVNAVRKLLTDVRPRPTAILTPTVFCGVTVLTTASQLGLKVPQQLSIMCLSHDRLCDYTSPSLAGYSFSMDRFAKEVHRSITHTLRHPTTNAKSTSLIMPDFVPGDSVGLATAS